MVVWLAVERETVLHAAYQTFGCPAAIMAAELAEGKSLGEAALVREEDIVTALGGLPEGKEHCPRLAVSALRAASLMHGC